jgi:hypothetical protein
MLNANSACRFLLIEFNFCKMKKIVLIGLMLTSVNLFAQDATVKGLQAEAKKDLADDTTHKSGWKKGINFNLGIAQGNSSNWAAGAEQSSLSINGYVNLFANLKKDKHRWKNNLDLFYALLSTTSQGTRKNDDRIDYFGKYTYQVKPKMGFGVVGNFRTQFTDGFDYNETPKVRTSGFMAPAYMTIAPGIDWTPTEYFSLFASPFSGRWTYVSVDSLGPLYSIEPGKKWRTEAGAFISMNFNKEILKNVVYKSRLDLYSNYLDGKAKNVDVFFTNIIAMKVNKFLAVTYNFDLIYDDDVRIFGPNGNGPRTQIKSLLSVGFSARL